MQRNTGVIGPLRSTSLTQGPGIHDLFDQYNNRISGIWTVIPRFISVTPSTTSVNEGSAVSFTVLTDNVSNQTLYFTITGSVSASDFTLGSLSGSITLTNNSSTFFLTMSSDLTTEGTETFQVQIRTGSTSGPIQLTSSAITINDTSQTPSATVTPNTTSKNEDGTTVVFTVNTTGFASGTLYWSIATISGTISTNDFVGGAVTGSFSVSSSVGSVTLTIAADALTEGTDSFQLQVRTTSTTGTIIGTSSTVTISDTSLTPAAPSYVTLGTKAPTLGATGATTYPASGWTGLQNASADDAFVTVTTPFSVTINGTAYTSHHMGSNTYITWGTGRTEYNSLSGSNPPQNKLMLGAADNSYQRVSTITSGTSYTRIRYEGNASTSGTVGTPGIILEITFFNPANYGGVPVIEILVGSNVRTGGVTGIATPSAFMLTWTIAVNTAYVLVGNSTGTTWTRYNGFVNNSGY